VVKNTCFFQLTVVKIHLLRILNQIIITWKSSLIKHSANEFLNKFLKSLLTHMTDTITINVADMSISNMKQCYQLARRSTVHRTSIQREPPVYHQYGTSIPVWLQYSGDTRSCKCWELTRLHSCFFFSC